MGISYKSFIHPEDEAARRQLEELPGFHEVTKLYMKFNVERRLHGIFMAQKIRLSPTQLPDIYNMLPPICEKFGIEEPEFYLEMNPLPNAYTMGDNKTFLVINSGLLEHLTKEELQAVIAHECGHILCRHVFYNTLTSLLLQSADYLGLLEPVATPVILALNYWSRRSELSADRAEVVFMGKSEPTIRALIRMAGGPANITKNINIEEYASQAQDYIDLQENSTWDKILQTLAIMHSSHPFTAVRVREILKWEQSEQYKTLFEAIQRHELNPTKICKYCGSEIEECAKFCRFCGTKF